MEGKRFAVFVRMVLSTALVGLLAFGAVGRASAGSIIRVKWNAGGANTGTSWTDAFTSLQTALGVAVSGDQIWVAKGTYYPTTGTDQTISFSLKTGVAMYGGFAGTETLLSQRKPTVNITFLSGDIGAAGVNTDNSNHVVVGSFTTSSAILDGFKIVGGFNCSGGAGGIYIDTGSPTLRNLTLSNNTGFFGGGMYNTNSSPSLVNVTFSSNAAFCAGGVGGGMYNNNSSPSLTNVLFSNNAGTYAGGMFNSLSNPTLLNVTFSGNTANNQGGGLFNDSSSPTLTNVTFSGNKANSADGGGILNANSSPTLNNVTMSGNTASTGGDGMSNGSSSNPLIKNSIFWGNGTSEILNSSSTPSITGSVVKGGCPAGSSCTAPIVISDPKLGPLQNNGGYTPTRALGAGSSAIDRGNNSTCAAKDQRGVNRPQGTTCDMGAFEVKALPFLSVATYDGWVLESTETSSKGGGSPNVTGTTLRLGDDALNRQYRSLVSFNTATLPDTATIVLAKLMLQRQGIVGTNPFTTHGALRIDIARPYFGTGLLLATSDFEAAATLASAGTVSGTPVSGYYWGTLSGTGQLQVNKTGTTQLRLRFTLDDNNDKGADYISFYSGNSTLLLSQPTLWVYYLP